MGVRGRNNQKQNSVVDITGKTGRPPPPKHLGDKEKELWRDIVGHLPQDWIQREHYELLAAYCRHAVRFEKHSNALDNMEKDMESFDFESYEKLAKLADRESRAMLAHARALRLTIQSRYDAAGASRRRQGQGGGHPPWKVGT